MKGIYISFIVLTAILVFTFDASAQGRPNGVGNGASANHQGAYSNGVGNGTSGNRAGSDIVMKGSKIGVNGAVPKPAHHRAHIEVESISMPIYRVSKDQTTGQHPSQVAKSVATQSVIQVRRTTVRRNP